MHALTLTHTGNTVVNRTNISPYHTHTHTHKATQSTKHIITHHTDTEATQSSFVHYTHTQTFTNILIIFS